MVLPKYINQKHNRDCLQASYANLLGIEYDLIPEFFLNYEEREKTDLFMVQIDDFLNEIGHYRIKFDVSMIDGKLGVPFYCSLKTFKCIGTLEKKGAKYSHAVLLELKRNGLKYNIEIIHDPKVGSDYTIDDLIQIEFILKK